MSLNFSFVDMIKRVGQERYEEITTSPFQKEGEPQWHPVTNALIWATLSVDLGEITEKNVDEWWFRIRLTQLAGHGNYRTADGLPDLVSSNGCVFITRTDIENHVGMSTNVTTRSRSSWLSRRFSKREQLPPLSQLESAHELCAKMAAQPAA